MDGSMWIAAGAACLSGLGMLESWWHRRALESIPIRIHVNGTRGKSGVTRLIAAGLRAGGLRTCAKTTGTLPRMIFPDGAEFPVFRPSRANVIEQLRVVRAAARAKADALVIECMALQPVLQSLCELKLVRATHGVITNARPDHLDVMGPDVTDVARALSGTVPVGGRFYTAEQKQLGILRQAAEDRGSETVAIGDDEVAQVTWDELDRFPYVEHPDNVALALKVCHDLGVDRATALEGMWTAAPDPGVMTVYQAQEAAGTTLFVNGFAANDPESTQKIWEMMLERYGKQRRHIAVVNCRADRADRSLQMADAIPTWSPAEHYVAIGTATELFQRRALARGVSSQKITCVEGAEVGPVLSALRRVADDSSLIMGMGNISGPGMALVNHFRDRHRMDLESTPTVDAGLSRTLPFGGSDHSPATVSRKAA